ncbi:MAG: hypothetical protein N5P05_000180 [Chroococcopsis gigantea SAG 12.99]|jgi:hypothetical protein|nr:carbohydrate porin [Chlorogloea purpurea SAG 13.99]MDV2998574.1 hypothetical protein [Chroococcopsis gigantea SAG 12.99]
MLELNRLKVNQRVRSILLGFFGWGCLGAEVLAQTPASGYLRPSAIPLTSGTMNPSSMSQIPPVSSLRDVKLGDWAYEALRGLVERYGCLVGYPDASFRGDRSLSRWEFAAGLNSCINGLERLLGENLTLPREDLATLQRLVKEFQEQLTGLGARTDKLESGTAFLEDHGFSTTTKLSAQVIWSLSDTFGQRVGGGENETQTTLGYRIRLNLETSFTGRDLLRTRLQAGNIVDNAPLTGTNMTNLNYADNSNNEVIIPHVWYLTPLTDSLTLRLGPVGVGYTDLVTTITPPTIADDSLGVPSKFGEYNPVYRRGGGGAGINWMVRDGLELSLGYLAGNAQQPTAGNGLFNGAYHALAQLVWYGDRGSIGLAYSRSYYPADPRQISLMAGTGSFLANQPFGDKISTTGNFYTLGGYYQLGSNFQVHAWGGYVDAVANGSGSSNLSDGRGGSISSFVNGGDRSSIWYGSVGFTFPDVGWEGFMPGLVLGIPPRVGSSSVRQESATAYHIETFYRLQINNNISLTPGFWLVINPENNSANATQWVGYLRTSFNF